MTEALISEYLGRLEAASWPLPASRRSELAAEVREHIETALSEAGNREETTVRNVLDRLGRPEDIVAAEVDPSGGAAGPRPHRSASQTASGWMPQAAAHGWGGIEIAAVLLLTAGALLLWWVGPIAGVVVAWFSDRWTAREKRVATAIVIVLVAVDLVLLAVLMSRMFSFGMPGFGQGFEFGQWPGPLDFGLIGLVGFLAALLPLLGGPAAGIYLAAALQRRR
jgi:hypothetical protein